MTKTELKQAIEEEADNFLSKSPEEFIQLYKFPDTQPVLEYTVEIFGCNFYAYGPLIGRHENKFTRKDAEKYVKLWIATRLITQPIVNNVWGKWNNDTTEEEDKDTFCDILNGYTHTFTRQKEIDYKYSLAITPVFSNRVYNEKVIPLVDKLYSLLLQKSHIVFKPVLPDMHMRAC